MLLVGLGGRTISSRGKVGAPSGELFHHALRVIAAVFGVIALLAGLTAVLVSSAYSLKIFVMASIVTWAAGVLNHI
jgi:hypothetical protein